MPKQEYPEAELDALMHYQSLSYEINAALWQSAVLTKDQVAQVELLETATSRYRSSEAIEVYRGGQWTFGAIDSGSRVVLHGFTSTTRIRSSARRYITSDCIPAALYTIICPAGATYVDLATIPCLADPEAEVLLGRGSEFIVREAFEVTELEAISEYVGPDPQKLFRAVWDVKLKLVS